MRVRALARGYFGDERRRPGDVFEVASEQQFSTIWMEKVDPTTPLHREPKAPLGSTPSRSFAVLDYGPAVITEWDPFDDRRG